MSFELGLITGLGRAAMREREERMRRQREELEMSEEQNRRSLGMLQRLVDTDNVLPDDARNVAAQHLFRLATNPKAKEKDFASAMQEIFMAANKPRATPRSIAADSMQKVAEEQFRRGPAVPGAPFSIPQLPPAEALSEINRPRETVSGILRPEEIDARQLERRRAELDLQREFNPALATPKYLTLSPGQIAVDPTSGRQIAAGGAKPVTTTEGDKEFERAVAYLAATKGIPVEQVRNDPKLVVEAERVYADSTGRTPRPAPAPPSEPLVPVLDDTSGQIVYTPRSQAAGKQAPRRPIDTSLPSVELKRRFDMERALATDWTKASTTVTEMTRQLRLMEIGLDRFKKGDKNGGSQGVLVTFQKILDPTSVVRESEYARSAAGISLLGRMQGYMERLAAGGAGVPAPELEAMVVTARQFLQGLKNSAAGTRSRIGNQAQSYGLDPNNIFSDKAPQLPALPTSQRDLSQMTTEELLALAAGGGQ